MKKTLLSSLMVGAMALTLSALYSTPVMASCPVNAQKTYEKKCNKPVPPECTKPMSPEENAKMREQKKTEFEARLNLTDAQKEKLNKIKADEHKALEPYREKIEKEQAKIEELFEQERAIRTQSMKKFDAILTGAQKAELEKIKAEIKEEMEKMAPPHIEPEGKMMPPAHHKPMCPPQCKCKCHEKNSAKAEPADCNCPCHKAPLKK